MKNDAKFVENVAKFDVYSEAKSDLLFGKNLKNQPKLINAS
jgi:hypothetical protein